MQLPIIINESGNLYFYKSVEDVEIDLEAIDVKNNEYTAYDGNGYLLQLNIINEEEPLPFFGKTKLENVKLCKLVNELDESSKLKLILLENLEESMKYSSEDKTMEFSELLKKAISFYGYE